MARHAKRRRKPIGPGDSPWSDDDRFEGPNPYAVEPLPEAPEVEPDWFAPSEPGEDAYAARQEVPLAAMLMLGEHSWQRIDGMGMARQALEAEETGDPRLDLSADERFLLANGRAWSLLVHLDLAHGGRRDDLFVLADAQRHIEQAQGVAARATQQAQLLTTQAMLVFRQDGPVAALPWARAAVDAFAALPDHERTGQSQGAGSLAVLALALVTGAIGDTEAAADVARSAMALRPPLDVDQSAFGALMNELAEHVWAPRAGGAVPDARPGDL